MARRQTVEADCAWPGCSSTFTRFRDSFRKYCDDHYKGTVRPSKGVDAAEIFEGYKKIARKLPPIPKRLTINKLEQMGFDTPQEGIALLGDIHYGSRIEHSATAGLAIYNTDIAKERLTRWRDTLLRFTQMNQALLPLETLHLIELGDDIEGHGEMFGSQKLQM